MVAVSIAEVTRAEGGRGYRLPDLIRAAVEDVAKGIEAGEAGVKSVAIGALVAADAGASAIQVAMRHYDEVELVADEDDCFDRIGDALASGFSPSEIAAVVQLDGRGVKLLALEQWAQRAGLRCLSDAGVPKQHECPIWKGNAAHERRRRAERAFRRMRASEVGTSHAAVLHIVYGWTDTFVMAMTEATRDALGKEFAPLARYTDAVEVVRQAMVAKEVAAYCEALCPGRGSISAAVSGQVRARADRCISSGDAFRHAVAGLTPDPHLPKAERQAQKATAERFVTDVRIEANRMLSEASDAFLTAWNEV